MKSEAGLVAIVMILVYGAFLIVGKKNLIVYFLVFLESGAILVLVVIYTESPEDDDWIICVGFSSIESITKTFEDKG